MSPIHRSFYKPVRSKRKELNGGLHFYYLVKVANYAKTMRKYKLGYLCNGIPPWSHYGSVEYFNREQINKFPKYMRRGGEYGHDSVIVLKKDGLSTVSKNLCKVYNITILYI